MMSNSTSGDQIQINHCQEFAAPKACTWGHIDEMASQSLDGKGICGVLSTAKARFSRSWSSSNATRLRRCGCCGHCFDIRPSFLRLSSPTNSDRTERRFVELVSRVCMSKGCAPTIAQRILINRFDANERCKSSYQPNWPGRL